MAWGSWLSKNKYAAMGAGASVIAATAAAIYWGVGPYPTRQMLAGGRFDSIAYFDRHAQPFFTKPAAAAKAWGWTMQEAAGNLTDTLSGDSEVLTAAGTPLYSRHTNIPRSDGFTWKAIAFRVATTDTFTAADNTKCDFPTNDFTIAGWINATSFVASNLVQKVGATIGYQLYFDTTLKLLLKDTGAHTVTVTLGTPPALHAWIHYAVAVMRGVTNTATVYINGVAQTPQSIATITDSLTNNGTLTIGWNGTNGLIGNMAGLMIANGAMSLVEVMANYRAFKLPNGMNNIVGTISAAQTTHRAYEIANVGGWGTQLGAYAGNATAANVQFPTSYSSTLVSTTNPGGLQTPAIAGMANVLGYAREFNSWTAAGVAPPATVADAAEAPDGLQTADRVTFGNNTSTLTRAVVGGGTIAAGERWHGQLYYRYVSGAACDIRLYNGTTRYVTLDTTATWHKAWVDNYTAAETKQLYLSRNGGTDCVYDFSDAQYYSSQFYIPAVCTVGYTGAAAYTCNAQAPIWTMSAAHLATLPTYLSRGELTLVGSVNQYATNGYANVNLIYGPGYYTSRVMSNVSNQFINQGGGGGTESYAVGRPLAPVEEKRTLTIPWDFVDGLTNTSPRKLFAGIHNGYPATTVLGGRTTTTTTGIQSNAMVKTGVWFDITYPSSEMIGGVESFGVYSRPAHTVYPATDPKHVLTVDTSGPAYLANASIPRFECPAGLATANCSIWDQSEWPTNTTAALAPKLYDRINGTELTAAGGDNYNITNSGLMARGAGRLAANFARASTEVVKASVVTIAALGAATTVTLEAVFRPRTLNTSMSIADSTKLGTLTGVGMWLNSSGTLSCAVGARINAVAAPVYIWAGQWAHAACTFTLAAGVWEVTKVYINAEDRTGVSAGVQPASIVHGEVFSIGGSTSPSYFDGHIAEVMLWGRALSAPEILAHYKVTTQTGQYWNATGQTSLVGHWPLNEYYIGNGTGAKDDSGNGNHLTVVAGSPDGRHYAMPWPAGSGVTKLGVETYSASSTYWSGSTIAPDAANPMSMMAWVRCAYNNDVQDIVAKQGGAPDYHMWLDNAGRLNCQWRDSGANATTSQNATDICDGVWHLVGCKLTYSAPNYVATSSINGGAFGNAGGNISGVLTGNAGAIRTLQIANGADRFGESGLAIIKNYAISDVEIAGYAKFGADPSGGQLTYTRTTTNNKVCHVSDVEPLRGTTVTCFPDSKFPYDSGIQWGYPNLTMLRSVSEYGPPVGFPTARAVTNYAYNSQAFNAWTLTNILATADDTTFNTQSPDGSQTADKLAETAVNAIHSVENVNTADVPQNGHVLNRLFVLPGSGITWIKMYIKDTAGNYYWKNLNITTGAWGNGGLSGANWVLEHNKTLGVNGWIMADLQAYCSLGGGCAGARVGFCIETADTNAACPAYLGVITKYIYAWEGEMIQCGTPGYDCHNYALCPTLGAATATCNAPTSQYVAAANMATWDRSTGAITQLYSRGWDNVAGVYALDLHNGANLNGAVRSTSIYGGVDQSYVYDNAGTLQQRIASKVIATVTPLSAYKLMWDSTGVFDTGSTTAGSKRSHGYTYNNTYAGAWDTYTTDLAGNWVSVAATNLWIGMDNAATATSILNGIHLRTTIHTR